MEIIIIYKTNFGENCFKMLTEWQRLNMFEIMLIAFCFDKHTLVEIGEHAYNVLTAWIFL